MERGKLVCIEGEDKVPHQRDKKGLQDEKRLQAFLCPSFGRASWAIAGGGDRVHRDVHSSNAMEA